MKIAFIGAGNMASAIIRGMCRDSFKGDQISAYDIDVNKTVDLAADWGIEAAATPEAAIQNADAVVVAIKPQMFASVLPPLRPALEQADPLIVSIAAGKTLADIAALVGESRAVVRVMPNICATVGEAISAYTGNGLVSAEHKQLVERILDAVGRSMELDEGLFSIFSAVASCSPAFTLMYIDALAQAGVKNGLPKAKALEIASQSVLGTALLLQQTGEHPRALMDAVCSPGGTTIEGVCALQREGLENAVLSAVQASLEKDKKL
ncbi:MAG: pyrroline-5-carboxylate reductase [Acutalibacteraceae bacterium]|jgi:pyrroline-5-carboxylate reductase